MAYKILLVEDDPELVEIITDYFVEKSEKAFKIDYIQNGAEVLPKCYEKEYDLVLLDVMLPNVDGFTICKELRKNSDIPIIFITARHNESDRLYGYNLGCDDYISKPFSLAELFAKATALIKRSKGMVRSDEIMSVGRIKLNPYRHTVFVDDEEVILAPMEFTVLKMLMENQGKVVTRERLLIQVWGYDFEGNERVVDNHVKKLRKSLGSAAQQIKTVFKQGYKLEG
ncbi:two component transcriptional regulator, winged helix family [Desulfonispora thiosulfatigenes DSM 11270]|uniref:Stage 0 sporulation protein A homolog n=1 Tax=Desulfonispora thiosulfatigenes DSM 11270 TaxID=656914 RepID=A0A1W1UVV3_DESTI|nr:response regulator transcription factor [Desulfonispora thiosulfatigenes]SMB85180.1 two component transcriptional regulator, winged helix family [Desulfonispora thiosulfatigenes DSM 11270]